MAGPPDRHRFRPVLGELEDLCHCATCGLPRDHESHDQDVAGPPDLAYAIQAARHALTDNYDWDGYDVFDVARLAVAAAAPVLLQDAREENQEHKETAAAMAKLATRREVELRATRDRLAKVEVYAAELADLLDKAGFYVASCDDPDADMLATKVRAALQVEPSTQGRSILEEVERYHVHQRALALQVLAYRRAALDTPAERNALQGLLEIVEGFEETAGDLGAAREEDSGG